MNRKDDLVGLREASIEFAVPYAALYAALHELEPRRLAGAWYVRRRAVRRWLSARRMKHGAPAVA